MDDPTYLHEHIEPEVEEPQVKPKKFYLKKTGQWTKQQLIVQL